MIFEKVKQLNPSLNIPNFKTSIYTNSDLENSPFLLKNVKQLIGKQRAIWLKEELRDKEPLICFAVYEKHKLIATRFLSYSLYDNMFDNLKQKLEIGTKLDYLVGSKLVVNEKYKRKGIASKLVSNINAYFFDNWNIDYILGDSDNPIAIEMYKNKGAIFFEKCLNDKYLIYYYKNPKNRGENAKTN